MQPNETTKDPHHIALRLYNLRKRSAHMAASIDNIEREMRKCRLLQDVYQVAPSAHDAMLSREIASTGAALVDYGRELARVGEAIDATMTA